MSRCTKLCSSFFSMDLYSGKTMLKPNTAFHCYLILDQEYSKDYITDQLLQLIMSSCAYIHFFGIDSDIWYRAFIRLAKLIYPNDMDCRTEWANVSDSFDDFINNLHHDLHCRPFVPRDIYLIYDNIDKYHAVLNALYIKDINYKTPEVVNTKNEKET